MKRTRSFAPLVSVYRVSGGGGRGGGGGRRRRNKDTSDYNIQLCAFGVRFKEFQEEEGGERRRRNKDTSDIQLCAFGVGIK